VALSGHRRAGGGVGRCHVLAVFEQALRDERDGVIQQRVGARGRDRGSGVALVADP
jgi:hypothetical protein